MRVLVTGSSGHLGEALMRVLPGRGIAPRGVDVKPGPFTDIVASVADRAAMADAVADMDAVVHVATLHKPHVATHSKQDFLDTNVTGTLTLLEAASAAGAERFVFASTTSAFGRSLTPAPGAPALWIDEDVPPRARNIYGASKTAAEDLCALAHLDRGMAAIVLRLSRFFPEEDDSAAVREAYPGENAKANEFLHRRVDLADAVEAHIAALERAPAIGFGRYVVSATTPFARTHLPALRARPGDVVAALFPRFAEIYEKRGFRMPDRIERVYDNARARRDLGWAPRYDFARVLDQLDRGEPIGSPLARQVGAKGYHDTAFAGDGPYPVA